MKKYLVKGMSCAACSSRVEKAVRNLDGVLVCNVNLLTNIMEVETTLDDNKIINAVRKAGYDACLFKEKESVSKFKNKELKTLLIRLGLSIFISLLLMYISMGVVMFKWPFFIDPYFNPLTISIIQLVLALLIMVVNYKFFLNGAKGIIKLNPNMDTLISLGSLSSFIYSLISVFNIASIISGDNANKFDLAYTYLHSKIFFDSAAMILTFILVGKTLEAYSKGKTTNAIKALMDLSPKTATLLIGDEEVEVKVEDVKVGDIFIVKPGENVPVDGVIIKGHSSLDESMISGESLLKDKSVGDNVISATNNKDGYLVCKATKVGNNTTINQIIKLVNDASNSKAPISKIADKVSGIFVPTVTLIAIITLIIWLTLGNDIAFALNRAISVLVISCPCALGLATPVAIMVGSGKGARNGVLYKNARAIENVGKAKIIVLDKTGTITKGEMHVSNIISKDNEILSIAYSLESMSEHPLANAVCKYCKEQDIPKREITDFKILPGIGVKAKLNNDNVLAAKYSYIKDFVFINEEDLKFIKKEEENGKTALFFAKNDIFLGVIFVSDIIKDDSKEAIKELKKLGLKVIMLTGDNFGAAKKIADEVEVDEFVSNLLPEQKDNKIKELMNTERVIMVGDGINDSIALTRADVGIALAKGSDVAIESADIVIVANSLINVVNAIKISKATIRVIHQNLFWAFIYNVIGIPLAAGALIWLFHFELTPMFGALAMSLSSFCVVINALRLNFVKTIKALPTTFFNKETNIKLEVKNMKKKIKVKGMMCKHCENRVKKALEKADGVIEAVVDYENGIATVELSYPVEDQVLKAIIEAEDYEVLGIE